MGESPGTMPAEGGALPEPGIRELRLSATAGTGGHRSTVHFLHDYSCLVPMREVTIEDECSRSTQFETGALLLPSYPQQGGGFAVCETVVPAALLLEPLRTRAVNTAHEP